MGSKISWVDTISPSHVAWNKIYKPGASRQLLSPRHSCLCDVQLPDTWDGCCIRGKHNFPCAQGVCEFLLVQVAGKEGLGMEQTAQRTFQNGQDFEHDLQCQREASSTDGGLVDT